MNSIRRALITALCIAAVSAAACAGGQATGPMVTLHENGKIRRIPASDFNEAAYLRRGYIKNTDPQGNAIYVFVPKQDYEEQPAFRGMDILNPNNNRDPTDRGGGGLNPGMGAGDDWR